MKYIAVLLFICIMTNSCASFFVDDVNTMTIPVQTLPKHYESLTLKEAACLAIENSAELWAAKKSIKLREGGWKLSLRSYFPNIEIGGGTDERLSKYSSDLFSKSIFLNVSQPLIDGGRLAVSRRIEAMEIEFAKADLRRKTVAVGEAAMQLYRVIISARKKIKIKYDTLELIESQKKVLAEKCKLGYAKLVEVIEADMQVSSFRLELHKSELALKNYELEFTNMLGLELLPELIDEIEINKPCIVLNEADITKLMIKNSPELLALKYRLLKKRTEASLAKFSWMPNISFKAGLQMNTEKLPFSKVAWTFGITIDFVTPFVSGSLNGVGGHEGSNITARTNNKFQLIPNLSALTSIENALLDAELEEKNYVLSVDKIRRNISMLISSYHNAIKKRDLSFEQVKLAKVNIDFINTQLALGQKTVMDLIQAEIKGAEAEIELIDSVVKIIELEKTIESQMDSASVDALFN